MRRGGSGIAGIKICRLCYNIGPVHVWNGKKFVAVNCYCKKK